MGEVEGKVEVEVEVEIKVEIKVEARSLPLLLNFLSLSLPPL